MKTLYLLRHAHSLPGDASLDDHKRPISQRGLAESSAVAQHLSEHRISCDTVISSTAERTRQTIQSVAAAYPALPEALYENRLYLATPGEMIAAISYTAPPEAGSVMVVGHNPGIHQLGLLLAANEDDAIYDQLSVGMVTCGLVTLDCHIDNWKELEPACGELRGYFDGQDSPALTVRK